VKVRRRRQKATRPSTKPQRAGALFDGTFRWLKLDEKAQSYRAMRAFSIAAGPRIGEHVRAERLRGSILYLRCDSSAWAQHLHMLKATLLERLAKTPGGEGVAELRSNVGPLDEVAGWEGQAPPRADEAPAEPAEPPEEVARALDELADPELRAGLYRLLQKLTPPKNKIR
jgi:Dna[CI] antecedent DciA-like protein